MARKSNAKPKTAQTGTKGTRAYSPAGAEAEGIREIVESGRVVPNLYSDIVQSLYKKNRKRVSTYYCPNTACRQTFWDADQGYACPSCGTLGLISEFRYHRISSVTGDRNIVGYLDTMGRLVCSSCILTYGVQNEIGLIVYDDTEPFCHEHCELCKEPLGQLQS